MLKKNYLVKDGKLIGKAIEGEGKKITGNSSKNISKIIKNKKLGTKVGLGLAAVGALGAGGYLAHKYYN